MTANVASNFSDVCQCSHTGGSCSGSWSRLKGFLRAFGVVCCLYGCGGATIHEPRTDLSAFAHAVARKDARAVHSMLDTETRRSVTVEQVAELLSRGGEELVAYTRRLSKARPHVQAHVGLEGGSQVTLTQLEGAFYIDSPGLNGGSALTPFEAVSALRNALESGSYTALLQVLTPELREQVEQHRKALIEALRYEEALQMRPEGERLIVETADGHRVTLERKLGVWRVHDFN
jgi:hypothetical protein